MTPDQLKDFVQDAASYSQSVGKEAALAEFSKKEGQFSHGDIYIYAIDIKGILLAHPYQSNLTGKNLLNSTDIRGLRVIKIANHTASDGGGFFTFLSPAPENGTIDEAAVDSYVPKLGYVAPVDATWWVASGIFFAELGDETVPEPVAAMIHLEKKGADFGRRLGRTLLLPKSRIVPGIL